VPEFELTCHKALMNFRNKRIIASLILAILLPFESAAFAAGGKKGKKRTSIGKKGFGAKSPSLESIVAKFPNRIPDNAVECTCPCGSGGLYQDCCSPFHKKEKILGAPIDVLRTRFTAFVWRMPQHIIETTHPTCRDYIKDKEVWAKDLNRDGMFDSYEFVSLEAEPQIFDAEDENIGYIDFKVNLRANASNGPHLEGHEIVVRERSKFIRSGKPLSWSYAAGEVTSDVAGIEDVQLNS